MPHEALIVLLQDLKGSVNGIFPIRKDLSGSGGLISVLYEKTRKPSYGDLDEHPFY